MAIAGDFDHNGAAEILLPSQNYMELAVVKHTLSGLAVIRSYTLSDRLSTNIFGFSLDGDITLAYGTADGILTVIRQPGR